MILFLIYGIIACSRTPSPRKNRGAIVWRVSKVVDGDTFWAINPNDNKIKIRLIGVDAPESRNSFRKKISPFGKVSKSYLTDLILGKNLTLEIDVDSLDQYGRTLAYAFLEDRTFVNDKIIKDGYGKVMTVPPNVKYVERFVDSQRQARENKLGVWKEYE